MNLWELAGVISKALIYAGMLVMTGGMLVLWMSRQYQQAVLTISRACLLPSALVGLLATCVFFLVQIGSVNQRGIAGMFDPLMGSILVDTEVGDALRWRLAGFLLALLALLPLNLPGYLFQYSGARRFTLLVTLCAATCFAVAVASQGHASAVSVVAEVLAAIHLLAIACWAGALYPLYLLIRRADTEDGMPVANVAKLLHRFGVYGWTLLAVMLVTGLSLIYLLTSGLATLLNNLHGQLLFIKLLLVAGMMGLGALHKFRWVPRLRSLTDQGDQGIDAAAVTGKLARSIRLEIALALMVLLVTASFTTITGPGS